VIASASGTVDVALAALNVREKQNAFEPKNVNLRQATLTIKRKTDVVIMIAVVKSLRKVTPSFLNPSCRPRPAITARHIFVIKLNGHLTIGKATLSSFGNSLELNPIQSVALFVGTGEERKYQFLAPRLSPEGL